MTPARILVIRLGALGDLVLCAPALQAIRQAHPAAEIALLTMPAFAGFARMMPWVDTVLVDERAPGWRLDRWWALRRRVQNFAPDFVYDLQGKRRQDILFALLGGPLAGPRWSGAATGCSHPRPWPPQHDMHFTDFLAAQLAQTGITGVPPADWAWCAAPLDGLALPPRFALLIAGCSPTRAGNRWPAARYAELAQRLQAQGVTCLAIGTAADRDAVAAIRALAPQVVDLTGQTSLPQLAALARMAVCIIGNDTGPTHLAAAVGAATLALIDAGLRPVWSTPKGPRTAYAAASPLAALTVEPVWAALAQLPGGNPLQS